MSPARPAGLFAHFFLREIKNRYLGSMSGLLWALLNPVILLALYTFLIAGVLKARIPGLSDAQWLPFVALGLWPWIAFSESVQRGANAVLENAGLMGKMALPSELFVLASVCASFALHTTGLLAVVLVLRGFGYSLVLTQLPVLLVLMAMLLLLSAGFAWLFAGLQVYVRDVSLVLGQAFAFLFFLTPVLYTPSMMPEAVRGFFSLNPISFYCQSARDLMMPDLPFSIGDGSAWAIAGALAIGSAVLGFWSFRKLSRHFEDFL